MSAMWAAWSAASFPFAVLLHECAHYVVFLLFRFPSPKLHYASSGFAAGGAFWQRVRAGDLAGAQAVVPTWQVGTASLAGLVATYLTVAGCIWYARRRPHPFVIALGLIATLRFLPMLITLATGRMPAVTDENAVARLLSIPELLTYAAGASCMAAAWLLLPRTVPYPLHRIRMASLLLGIVGGGIVYINLLGPRLLP